MESLLCVGVEKSKLALTTQGFLWQASIFGEPALYRLEKKQHVWPYSAPMAAKRMQCITGLQSQM